jgi:hypothetical protein
VSPLNRGIIILENVNSDNPLVSFRLLTLEQSVTGIVVGDLLRVYSHTKIFGR